MHHYDLIYYYGKNCTANPSPHHDSTNFIRYPPDCSEVLQNLQSDFRLEENFFFSNRFWVIPVQTIFFFILRFAKLIFFEILIFF